MRSKLIFTLVLLFSFGISLIFLSSCGEDEETPPEPATILLNPDITTFEGEPGDVVETQISVNAPAGLISVTVNKKVGDDSPSEYDKQTPASGENQLIFDFSYTLIADEVGETLTFDIIVEDAGSTTSATKSFTVETNSPTARSYTAKLLYAPTGLRDSETFFSTNTGLAYTADDIVTGEAGLSGNVDFGYYYLNATGATLSSPSAYRSSIYDLGPNGQNWGTLNATAFRTTDITASEFTEFIGSATFADIDDAYEAGTATTTDDGLSIQDLAINTVFAIETDSDKEGGSKRALILVTDLQEGFNEGDFIQLEILVQEPAE